MLDIINFPGCFLTLVRLPDLIWQYIEISNPIDPLFPLNVVSVVLVEQHVLVLKQTFLHFEGYFAFPNVSLSPFKFAHVLLPVPELLGRADHSNSLPEDCFVKYLESDSILVELGGVVIVERDIVDESGLHLV